MVSLHSTNRTIGVHVLTSPTLMALLLEGTVGLNVVIFPAVFAGAFKSLKGSRRGVSPGGRAPAII